MSRRIARLASWAWLILIGLHPACAAERGTGTPSSVSAKRVLVLRNGQDSVSVRVGRYYARRREVPAEQIIDLRPPVSEEISLNEYLRSIEDPVRAYLKAHALSDSIDFIVLCKGVPLRIREGGWSVDGFLATMDLPLVPVYGRDPNKLRTLTNPYFGKRESFRHGQYGLYLVTRLDGFTEDQARALVDHALEATPNRGPFLLSLDPHRDTSGYRQVNDAMRRAAILLRSRRCEVRCDSRMSPEQDRQALAGYYSWGSNDASWDPRVYKNLRFLPGAIAETAVSTSARTFRPTDRGQSLIADLIAAGVTGIQGYVSEPLASALCQADILLERYTAGFNLAESFAMASPLIKWKGLVVGDPLCRPYPSLSPPSARPAPSSGSIPLRSYFR